jgi:hypothetical protein
VPTHCVRGARAALTAQGVRATAADDAERCWRPASRRGEEPAYRGGAASPGSSWRAWVAAVIGASAAIAVSPLPYPRNEISAEHLPYRRPLRHRSQLFEAVVCLHRADLSHHGRRRRRPPPHRCAGRPASDRCGPQHPSAAPRRRYPALIWLLWGLFRCSAALPPLLGRPQRFLGDDEAAGAFACGECAREGLCGEGEGAGGAVWWLQRGVSITATCAQHCSLRASAGVVAGATLALQGTWPWPRKYVDVHYTQ